MPERSLTIALDARELPLGPSGDRTYLLGLLREYAALVPDWRFLLCYQDSPGTGVEAERLPPGFETPDISVHPGWLWTPWAWPRLLKRERVDVAHAQHIIPPFAPCPTIVTIHDVSFLRHPEWFPPRHQRIMRTLIPLSAKRATCVVCGASHAADEIAELCRVPRAKIRVIPYGFGSQFAPGDRATARERIAATYELRHPYVLAVGLIQPRKNVPRLLEAFSLIAPHYPELWLAIAGRAGWEAEALLAPLDRLRLRDRVALLGPVPDEHLPDLYRAAEMLVYPSLYEGFGLPPLEAMACGTPVIAAHSSSLPEVVGDAGLLVDPLQVEEIAAAMRRLLDDPGLSAALREAGLRQAAQFSWRRCAEGHLGLYEELAR